jgi:hypothetical protein
VLQHLNFFKYIFIQTNGQTITVLEQFITGFIKKLRGEIYKSVFFFLLYNNFCRYKILDAFKTFLKTLYLILI